MSPAFVPKDPHAFNQRLLANIRHERKLYLIYGLYRIDGAFNRCSAQGNFYVSVPESVGVNSFYQIIPTMVQLIEGIKNNKTMMGGVIP